MTIETTFKVPKALTREAFSPQGACHPYILCCDSTPLQCIENCVISNKQDIDPTSDDLPDIETVRERVLDALALLRSANILSSIDPSLPPERVAFELCRMWFDAIYTPGHRYMEGYKGDRDEEAALEFESAFTEDEFEYLERFNRFLELRIDRLSSKDRESGRFPISDTWRGIMRDADNLLELIEGDLQKTRRLEGVEVRTTALLEAGGWKGVLEQRSLES